MSGKKKGQATLLVGTAEVDITPPVGTALAGGLKPRPSLGVEDPLYVKAIVLESGGQKLACVVFDLVALSRKEGDLGVALACQRTGIPEENIVWAATHTHTGPYTMKLLYQDNLVVNQAYLAGLPEKMAQAVALADKGKVPARFCRQRSFHPGLVHNRRVTLKNGQAINTWNLPQVPSEIQAVGSSGPTDPEIGLLSFEDEAGNLLAVMFHYTLHTNTNFGPRFSADYPAVVAARLRERFGPEVVTLFLPGACGDINTPGPRHRAVGDGLAERIIPALENRQPKDGPVALASLKQEVVVPRRDFTVDQEKRIATSGWPAEVWQIFRDEVEALRREGKKEDRAVLQAWRIGDVAFASLPGELFVEWGLKIKKESPFPWTYPVELGGDYLGYLVTERAWQEGGYEALIARSARPSVEGVAMLVETVLKMLHHLHQEKP
ncbi:MAG TPA: hypothetical protein PKX93_02240 [bacterium]|nr:hypothetical protein [bacterium]